MQSMADMMGELAGRMAAKAQTSGVGNPEDYVGGDGLLVCGKCHTPKQCRVEIAAFGLSLTPHCACKCEREAFEVEKEAQRNRERMIQLNRLRSSSLMSGKMLQYTFDKFDRRAENAALLGQLRHYADDFREMLKNNQGLILWGPVGTGKTFAAACIANALMDKGWPVLATSMVKIMQADKFGDGDDEFIARSGDAALMVLDDLGAERGTDFALERVYAVIDGRARAGKPMVITTNLTLGQMMDADDIRYRRIYSRVLETCYPIEVAGVAWRTESAAVRFEQMRQRLEGGVL